MMPASAESPLPSSSTRVSGLGRLQLVLIALLIGSLFSVLMPSMKSFDESDHLRRAWLLTRGKLMLETPACTEESPLCQQGRRMSGGRIDAGLNEYLVLRHSHVGTFKRENQELQEAAAHIRWKGEKVFHEAPGTGYYFPLIYLPQALGLGLGEALDISVEHSYYLARFFTLLFTVLTLVLAFSMLSPSPLILALLVLPMSLFQVASASLDAFSTALAVLATCAFIRGMTDGAGAPAVGTRHLKWIGLVVFLVATSRAHLITMLLMPIALAWRIRTRPAIIIATLTTAAVLGWLALAIPATVDFRVIRTASTGEITAHYLGNPGELYAVFARTLAAPDFLHSQLRSFIGHSFGLTFSHRFYDTVFWLLVVLGILSLAGWRQLRQALPTRLLLLSMGGASVFLALLAMLLTFSVHPAQIIAGVQGRYFLVPVILMSLAVCDWRNDRGLPQALRWSLFVVILATSVLSSAFRIVDDFHTGHGSQSLGQAQPTPQLSPTQPIRLRFASLHTGAAGLPASPEQDPARTDPSSSPAAGTDAGTADADGSLIRIGILMATYHDQAQGTARIVFVDEEGNRQVRDFPLDTLKDNAYRFFDLPAARYVAGHIELLAGRGGLSVWEVRMRHDDVSAQSWMSCAQLTTSTGEQVLTPGCQ